MARLNILQGKIQDTLNSLEKLRKDKDPKNAHKNKEVFDALIQKLNRYQTEKSNLGKEYDLVKVTLIDGQYLYYTGLDPTEVAVLIHQRGLSYLSIVNIVPGFIYSLR